MQTNAYEMYSQHWGQDYIWTLENSDPPQEKIVGEIGKLSNLQ